MPPHHFAFVVGWLFVVLGPAVVAGPNGGVRLAEATLEAASIPFLQHCPSAVLVVHLQVYALLVPTVLLVVWGRHQRLRARDDIVPSALAKPIAQAFMLLAVTEVLAALYTLGLEQGNVAVTVAWSLRLLAYEVLLYSTLSFLVLGLAVGVRRYVWTVAATLTLVSLQSALSIGFALRDVGSWLPSQLRLDILSGAPNSLRPLLGLSAWAMLMFAVLVLRTWRRLSRGSALTVRAAT